MRIFKFIAFLFVVGVNWIFAQNSVQDNDLTQQIWISQTFNKYLSNDQEVYGEFGYKGISPSVWNRYYIKGGYKYTLPKLFLKQEPYRESLTAGLGIYFTDNNFETNRMEIRPYQGYLLDWPDWERFRLRHYFRLEERFDLNTKDWVNTFGMRFRYLVDLTFKLQGDIIPEAKGIYIPLSAEFFWNLIGVRQFNDVVRTNIGIGSNFPPKWRLEFRFGYQYARNTTTEDFETNDLIYQVKAYYTIN